MKPDVYDVAVVGAGVAGASCALLAARAGLRVVLIDASERDGGMPRPDWLPSRASALLKQWKVDTGTLLGAPFAGAVFHSADLAQHVDTTESDPPAFRVDYTALARCLRAQARGEGVAECYGATPKQIDCGEQSVNLIFPDRDRVEARFVVRADGAEPADSESDSRAWVAELQLPAAHERSPDRLHWVLGLDRGRTLLSWWADGRLLIARMYGREPVRVIRRRLIDWVSRLAREGWVGGAPPMDPEQVMLRVAPDRLALEQDSHVGKRTLRIGDAGGFVAASTREGVYPALRSAALAAETLARAARHRMPQDALQTFNRLWRSTLANELVSSDAHTPFLLPLVFRNPQMAQRLAAIFWRGPDVPHT